MANSLIQAKKNLVPNALDAAAPVHALSGRPATDNTTLTLGRTQFILVETSLKNSDVSAVFLLCSLSL